MEAPSEGAVAGGTRCSPMPSSVIRHFDYDPAAERLDVLFVSGRLYSYYDVPERLAERLRHAPSKGSFFNRRIRNHFRFTRAETAEPARSRHQ